MRRDAASALSIVIWLLVASAFMGCTDNPAILAPTGEVGSRSTAQSLRPQLRTLDDEFVDLNRSAPGFGGLFYDSAGKLTVYLTDTTRRGAVASVIAQFLSRGKPADYATRLAEVAHMRVLRADFDFSELAEHHRGLVAIAANPSVTMMDIDEVRNRVVVGVASGSAITGVTNALEAMGIPRAATIVEVVPPSIMSSLQGMVRPVPPSVEIRRVGAPSHEMCSLSFNARVRYPDGSLDVRPFFVTASHCTDSVGVNNWNEFGQPNQSDIIGQEWSDPPFFHAGANSDCPLGFRCRYSDAALFRYYYRGYDNVSWDYGSPPAFGRIPSVGGSAPFPIIGWKNIVTQGGYHPSMDHLYAGLPVAKTGRTTGRTTGNIGQTCAGVRVYLKLSLLGPGGLGEEATDRWLLCQFQASYHSEGGDSGSPVYFEDAQGNVNPVLGVHWGRTYTIGGSGYRSTFSDINLIGHELGQCIPGGAGGGCGASGYVQVGPAPPM